MTYIPETTEAKEHRDPPLGTLSVVRLKYGGDWDPEPAYGEPRPRRAPFAS